VDDGNEDDSDSHEDDEDEDGEDGDGADLGHDMEGSDHAPLVESAGEEDHSDEDEDDEEEVVGNGGIVSSNPGSPRANAEGKNWHSYETLMNKTYPAKSKTVYLKAYKEFEHFLKTEEVYDPATVPSELSILNYFYFLKTKKKWGATTIWSHYSRINAVMKRKFGASLNTIPSVTDLLKSYSAGHRVKKSSVFTPQQDSFCFLLLSCLFSFLFLIACVCVKCVIM
jgi:hypothetical protein